MCSGPRTSVSIARSQWFVYILLISLIVMGRSQWFVYILLLSLIVVGRKVCFADKPSWFCEEVRLLAEFQFFRGISPLFALKWTEMLHFYCQFYDADELMLHTVLHVYRAKSQKKTVYFWFMFEFAFWFCSDDTLPVSTHIYRMAVLVRGG